MGGVDLLERIVRQDRPTIQN